MSISPILYISNSFRRLFKRESIALPAPSTSTMIKSNLRRTDMNSNARSWPKNLWSYENIWKGARAILSLVPTRVTVKSPMETISVNPMGLPLIPSGLLSFVSRPRWPRGHRPILLRLLLAIWHQRALTFTTCIVLNYFQDFALFVSDDKIEKNKSPVVIIIITAGKIIRNYFNSNNVCITFIICYL